MRIAVTHTSHYQFENPACHGLQRLRLRPRDCAVQRVLDWSMQVEGGVIEAEYADHNGNTVDLLRFLPDSDRVTITCGGLVETVEDTVGVAGLHAGDMPLWSYLNHTALTRPGPAIARLVKDFSPAGDADDSALDTLHRLSERIAESLTYAKGQTEAGTTAEQALAGGSGVCQDYAHVFIAGARQLGLPARYVSGYLLLEDRAEQTAGHGWAEAHVPGLGWVAFDVPNEICPDSRYVRVAVGNDYADAAPITSIAQGAGTCALDVELSVARQMAEQ